MKSTRRLLLLFLALACTGGSPASGREVILGAGESYTEDDLTVRCLERREREVIILTECQVWDQFNEVCLYERRRHRYGDLECMEECQHWDDFDNACHFAAECRFYPSQRSFVRTSCDVFDKVENVCRRTKQELIK